MSRPSAMASKIRGICALCKETRFLCDSHLIPKGFYRLIADRERTNPNPALITRRRTKQTSKQLSDYLLCGHCEDLFRIRGEDWVIKHSYRAEGHFKLRDLLWKAEVVDGGETVIVFAGDSVPEIKVDQLIYFAASIIWRSTVHDWRLEGKVFRAISLGVHEEEFRKYLLGRADFPESAVVWVSVSPLVKPPMAITSPTCTNWGNHWAYNFYIPGIYFDIFTGKEMPQLTRAMCSWRSPRKFIFASEKNDFNFWRDLGDIKKVSRPSPHFHD